MKYVMPWFCFLLSILKSGNTANVTAGEYPDIEVSENPEVPTIMLQWHLLDFNYTTKAARQKDIDSREFIPENAIPYDVDPFYNAPRKIIFVTIPRFKKGIPATLGTIKWTGAPVDDASILPFPNWSWHKNPEQCLPNRLVSVIGVAIDNCGSNIWVLDSGRLLDKIQCAPQVLAFNPLTNELVHQYEIPEILIESTSLLTNIIIDARDSKCDDIFIYIADSKVPALIVFDVKNSKFWKIIDKTMYPYPNFGTIRIAGQSFELMAGIFGMDLSPYKSGQDRILYYHALSSGTENWVHTSYLRNSSIQGVSPAPQIFHTYPNKRHSQAASMAIDRDGIAYFGLESDTSINCWNTNTPYKEHHIHQLYKNRTTMQFVTGVKLRSRGNLSQKFWFLTNSLQKVYTETLNPNEINFRIHAAQLNLFILRSKCRSTTGCSH